MKNPLKRKTETVLSPETAQQMLSNVFVACGRETNSVPLETFISYSNYRKERYSLQRTIIAAVLLMFMLLPVLFMAADVHVSLANPDSGKNPVYAVSVDSAIPMRLIQANQDGRNVPIYEVSENEYMLQPRTNGDLHISVTLRNRQRTEVNCAVEDVDMTAPALVSSETAGDAIRFYLSDPGSGVDFAGISILDEDGNRLEPLYWDGNAGYVDIPYPQSRLQIAIPDRRGNELNVSLKPE